MATEHQNCPPSMIPQIIVTDNNNDATNVNDDLYSSRDLDDELDDILDELEHPSEPLEPVMKEAFLEFAEAQQKKKYLFDGQNMIRIVPKKAAKMKAVFGKAYWLHKKIRDTMSTVKAAVIEKAAGIYSGLLSDYVAETGPKIPPLVYHSVKEIERREPVTRAWIYQTPASNGLINKVKRRFMRGKIPNLAKYEVHVPAQAIIGLLSEIREPLIPSIALNEIRSSDGNTCRASRVDQLKRLISSLPEENRATLKFLLLHLQSIANCRHSKVSLGTLAVIFAPLLIRTTSEDPREMELIAEVMFGLLKIEQQFLDEGY